MKLKNDCCLRSVAGEDIIIRSGDTETDLTNLIAFNPTAAWLWRCLSGKEFTEVEATALLLSHYEVDAGTAVRDVRAWLPTLEYNNLLEP